MELFKIFGTIALNGQNQFNSDIDTATQRGSAFATKLTKGLHTVAKAGAAALTAVGTGMVWLSKQAIDSYGDYEQLVGGVETLFKDSAGTVQQYAQNAYKSAGLSANEYMETVTSFSASLLQSLGNDTAAAAEMADLAITDMSDNANKMGTDMTAIQNAYNGFAKQNYTMLDNLKLGYGGTKSEMERLLQTANEINKKQGIITNCSIENYADIVAAIHDVQTEMGITGTTALEASTTIQGSISSMKSAWKNLLAGISDPNQDLGLLIDNMVETAGIALDNLAPRIINLLPRLATAIGTLIKKLNQKIPGLIREMLPALISGAVSLIAGVIAETPSILSALWDAIKATWETLKQEFPILDDIEKAIEKIISAFEPLQPIFDDLKEAFKKVRESAQPLVEKFGEYVTEGGLVEDITNGIKTAAQWLAGAYEDVKTNIQTFLDGLPDYITNGQMMEDITEAVKEAVGWLAEKFTAAKEALQPFIDELGEYVTSGQLGADISRTLTDTVKGVANGFKDAVTWCKEHETGLQTLAIAFGTLTTAIAAYNVVQAIKNAGGIVELAQLAAIAIGVGALTVAEHAHTVASTIATVATTAFGAAMAFLTSPITVIILAIGALIAIVVALVKNWDTVKETAQKCVDKIVEIWGVVCDWFDENVVQPVVEKFTEIWNSIIEVFSGALNAGRQIVDDIKRGISDAWEGVKSWFSNLWDGLFGNLHADVSVSKTASEGGVDGSHARGLDFVPFDGYVAELHKGEMVVPAAEAGALRSGYFGTQSGEMASLLKQILSAIEDSNRKETVLKINNREFGRAVRGAVNA